MGSDIHYPCGCVEYFGVTDPYGDPLPNIICKRDMAHEEEIPERLATSDSDRLLGNIENRIVVRWDCPRRNQRSQPINAQVVVKKRSGQVVHINPQTGDETPVEVGRNEPEPT